MTEQKSKIKPIADRVSVTINTYGMDTNHAKFVSRLALVLQYIATLLVYKNIKYGNSVFRKEGIFSKLDNEDSINIRIDDKLGRIKNECSMASYERLHQDPRIDLLGYLIILLISKVSNYADYTDEDKFNKYMDLESVD